MKRHRSHRIEHSPLAEIVHDMPGRARLRIGSRQGDAVYFASIASGLSAIEGVHDVSVTPLTGSILIHHSGTLSSVCEGAREAKLFDATRAAAEAEEMPAVDPKTLVALGLCVVAVWQVAKGRNVPPALTLLWYASGLSGLRPNGQSESGFWNFRGPA